MSSEFIPLNPPTLYWIPVTGPWRGLRCLICNPKLDDVKEIVRANPVAWIEA